MSRKRGGKGKALPFSGLGERRKRERRENERRSWKNKRYYWIRIIFNPTRKIRPPECPVKGLLFLFAYNLICLSKTPVISRSHKLQKETAFSSDFLLIIYRFGARLCCISLVSSEVITVHICTYAQLPVENKYRIVLD